MAAARRASSPKRRGHHLRRSRRTRGRQGVERRRDASSSLVRTIRRLEGVERRRDALDRHDVMAAPRQMGDVVALAGVCGRQRRTRDGSGSSLSSNSARRGWTVLPSSQPRVSPSQRLRQRPRRSSLCWQVCCSASDAAMPAAALGSARSIIYLLRRMKTRKKRPPMPQALSATARQTL